MINFEKMKGLIPAVVQDVATREVLMVGFMNEEAYERTRVTSEVWFWSRTKQRLWKKGETSGNVLQVKELWEDCDQDTLLILVEPAGPTCHTGKRSCFGETFRGMGFLGALERCLEARKKDLPSGSYTTSLYKGGVEAILAKVEEESLEVLQAARVETKQRLKEEVADLVYHLGVLLVFQGLSFEDVMEELEKRKG
ncbi:bifunctional phosphoribosyl-AMP cyclohydrolase/phosphoribosyl-ATP diphosphatase HisIE [Candidatus Peregrinibacteria bacterium]|jgi:phosphoribosyl-AMP cyclohydrolase / phosphoribosyl-ATP pyrophosphohydrolase|nr:bifunctional phosphoribosyl-AMP cyclohydrolase/phosphoribosyl-ATP diphosphatase HisIE [Candidatus Peregrinibacteria bacterium]MBT7703184.1 bifunctional phosphoribosyl-AMP cyclohydrolase/phosphoribosyl-ATP diphosphatase HisIE [Candidatus Peregrinibacteria bacterium]